MAKIVAMLKEDGRLKPGGREYRIARKLVARKIERLGPDAALIQVVDRMPHLMGQIRILMQLEESSWKLSHLNF